MTTNLSRTTAHYRSKGILYWKVEQWNQHVKKRVDLFHIIDLIVLDGQITGVQCCGSDFKPHIYKMTIEHAEYTKAWIRNGGRLVLVGWRKVKKKRGGKQMIWRPRVADFWIDGGEIRFKERPEKRLKKS